MSDDLIRRLRATQPKDSQYGETAREAAAEIEHLQSALPAVAVSRETLNIMGDEVVSRINEWDDRTSPDDFPEALLITSSELHRELMRFADAILSLQLHDRAAGVVK